MPDSTLNRRSVALLRAIPNELSYPQKTAESPSKVGLTPSFSFPGVLIGWRSPPCAQVSWFAPTLPVSGRGWRALHLGNKGAEGP